MGALEATSRVLRSRWVWGPAAALCVATGLVGLAHTEAGRPMLAMLQGAPGCPVDPAALTPAGVERARLDALSGRAGSRTASTRNVWGFELGASTLADVRDTMESQNAECESLRDGGVLRCTVSSSESTPVSAQKATDLHMQFDQEARLVALDVVHGSTSGCAAVAFAKTRRDELERSLGPVTQQHGEWDAHYLGARNLRRAADEYRYRDVIAQVSALHLGKRGVRVRERYQWVPSGA